MDLLLNRQCHRPIPLAQVNYAQTKYQNLISRAFIEGLIDKKKLVNF